MSELPPTTGPPEHILYLLKDATTKKHRSPIHDPRDPNYWWRVLPNDNSPFHRKPLGSILGSAQRISPGELMSITERHFDKLAEYGIENANVQHVFSEGPQGLRLFSLNEHVTGITDSELSKNKQLRPMFRLIGSRILQYANWVERTKQPFLLFDLPRPNQYIYGTTVSIPEPETILFDTDPFLEPNSDNNLREFRDRADQMVHR